MSFWSFLSRFFGLERPTITVCHCHSINRSDNDLEEYLDNICNKVISDNFPKFFDKNIAFILNDLKGYIVAEATAHKQHHDIVIYIAVSINKEIHKFIKDYIESVHENFPKIWTIFYEKHKIFLEEIIALKPDDQNWIDFCNHICHIINISDVIH